jgi:ABC-type multidrug transport system ATPase subunit
VRSGELYALLGPNGAGKTTLHSMLTTLLVPSTGAALVDGVQISDYAVRSHMGVCTQFDRLFGFLTPLEMCGIFARLRGVAPADVDKAAYKAVLSVGLWAKRDAVIDKFSGGQKRKLSVACSLVGGSPVVFLDEPTTGMDTNSRRHVWKCMQEQKDRAVVLTTHSMEEADALASRIGIVVNGEMKVEGTKTELKERCSSGYILTMRCKAAEAAVETAVKSLSPGAVRTPACAGEVHVYELPAGVQVADLFAGLEARKPELDIAEYTIAQSTLDDVFVKFAALQTREEHVAAEAAATGAGTGRV